LELNPWIWNLKQKRKRKDQNVRGPNSFLPRPTSLFSPPTARSFFPCSAAPTPKTLAASPVFARWRIWVAVGWGPLTSHCHATPALHCAALSRGPLIWIHLPRKPIDPLPHGPFSPASQHHNARVSGGYSADPACRAYPLCGAVFPSLPGSTGFVGIRLNPCARSRNGGLPAKINWCAPLSVEPKGATPLHMVLGHLQRAQRKEEQREKMMVAAAGFRPSRRSVPIGGPGSSIRRH
jgi:hypothetical protein